MKNRIEVVAISIMLCLSLQDCNSQKPKVTQKELIGVWQVESEEIGSTLLDNYHFFPSGDFIFNLNGYDEIKRVVSILGKYSLEADTLAFKVESTIEVVGGKLIRMGNLTSAHNSWALSGYKQVKVEQNDSLKQLAIIDTCEFSSKAKCIYIDNNKFYKISDDPGKFN